MLMRRMTGRVMSRLRRRGSLTALVVGLLLAFTVQAVQAVPAFARKYQTSCQTCHVAYPKLNSFGQAFRVLGYRMPGETEAQVKQPDVPLGSPAYKRAWPNAVWPGTIPAHAPISISSEFLVQNSSALEGDEIEKVDNEFIFPAEVALLIAGTTGEKISYFGEIAFSRAVEDGVIENEVEVEHLDFRLIRPIRNSTAFNAKIGAFQPELVSTFDHARRLTVANYDSMFSVSPIGPEGAESVGSAGGHGGGAGLSLPAIATGFEFYGVVKGRWFWTAGLVNGLGPGEETFDGNSAKDIYGRLSYKWGGLAVDGSNSESYSGSSKNWRERSFAVGAFAYRGDGSGILVPVAEEADSHAESLPSKGSAWLPSSEDGGAADAGFLEDENFTRIGLDFNWYFDDLNIFGAYYEGEDDLRVFSAGHEVGEVGDLLPALGGTFKFNSWFVEADAVLRFPWLHGALRYEAVDLPHAGDWERAVCSVTGLIRANVKATAEYVLDLNESDNHSYWLNFGIAF